MAESKTLTLSEFLLDRIAEDEARLEGTGRLGWAAVRETDGAMRYTTAVGATVEAPDHWCVDGHPLATGDVTVHYDARRVLAECEAKRRIVDTVQRMVLDADDPAVGMSMKERFMVGSVARNLLSSLALPYADHPDYRQEWRP